MTTYDSPDGLRRSALGRTYEEWEQNVADRVLREARRLRKQRKLSARDLSARLAVAGWPLTVNSVNGVLGSKGRTAITIPQLIALADALEVAPIRLLFPADESETGYRPNEATSPENAVAWFTGASGSDERLDSLRLQLESAIREIDALSVAAREVSRLRYEEVLAERDRKNAYGFDLVPFESRLRENWHFNHELPDEVFARFVELMFAAETAGASP